MSEGRQMSGQSYNPTGFGIIRQFTEQMMDKASADALLGTDLTEITPNDRDSLRVRIWEAQTNLLESFYIKTPQQINIQLPPVLESITVVYNESARDGEDVKDAGYAITVGTSGSATMTANASATASASIIPEVSINITEKWTSNVPATLLLFYKEGNFTTSELLAHVANVLQVTSVVVAGVVTTSSAHDMVANQPFQFSSAVSASGGLTTAVTYYVKVVNSSVAFTYAATVGGAALTGHAATSAVVKPSVFEWPRFQTSQDTLILFGEQVTVSVNASSSGHISYSSSNWTIQSVPSWRSDGFSHEVGNSVKTLRLPPTIHGAITISDAVRAKQVSARVQANVPVMTGFGDAPTVGPINNAPPPKVAEANASVTPTSLEATTVTEIPSSGLYMWSSSSELFQDGYSAVRVELVNMGRL